MNLSLPAPSAPPTFVSVSSVTSSNITVQWRAVDCIHCNGDITGHIVQYGIQGSGSTVRKNVPGGSATEATLTGLTSATAYYVEVAAVNSVGIEVYSESISILTEGKNNYRNKYMELATCLLLVWLCNRQIMLGPLVLHN